MKNNKCKYYVIVEEEVPISEFERGLLTTCAWKNGNSALNIPKTKLKDVGYCDAQKNIPQCYCKGDKDKCDLC